MITAIFYIFLYLVESLIANIYFSDICEKRYSIIKTYLLGALIYTIGFVVNMLAHNHIFLNLITFFVITVVLAVLLYRVKLKNAIFHSALLLAVMYGSEMVVDAIIVSLKDVNFDSYKSNLLILIVLGIISKLVYLIICKLMSAIIIHKNVSFITKTSPMLFVFPIMSTFMLMMFTYESITYNFTYELNVLSIVISTLSIVMSCCIFIYNQKVQQAQAELINLQAEKQKNELNKAFYELLEKKNEEQRILVHDLKHHYSAIALMDNIADVKDYIKNVQPQLDNYQFIGITNNKMLDMLLSRYSQVCAEENIRFFVEAATSNLSFINNNDLVSMLSNILDNAVEAAKATENAYISFSAKRNKSFYILTVVNSSKHTPKSDGDKLITTKKDSMFHGYGTKSVQRTAEKYNGMCTWQYDSVKKVFTYSILFNKS